MKTFNYLIFFLLFIKINSQRDVEAEGFCQPFLTSPKTSPLITNKRNIILDEQGEFYCELVLQDRYLPPQIRVTIHEGLAYLAIRHTQIGLQRQKTIIRHLKKLVELLPNSFTFNSKAGSWSLDPMILNIDDAITFLTTALYSDKVNISDVTDDLLLDVRRNLARALTLHGDYILAQREYYHLLRQIPTDFGIAFLLRQVTKQVKESEGIPIEDIESALEVTNHLYNQISQHQYLNYTGYIPTSNVLNENPILEERLTIPTSIEFQEYVNNRRPFIVRGSKVEGSLKNLIGWNTDLWVNDPTYLINNVRNEKKDEDDEDLTVLIERKKKEGYQTNNESLFGFGYAVHHVHVPFVDYLKSYFCEPSKENCNKVNEEWIEYLNIQDLRDQNGSIYRPPLYLPSLKNDIPMLEFLQSYVDENTMTDINLWMGNTLFNSDKETKSRLHMDALDNLYVLLSGEKTFHLISPNHAIKMKTISPTYAVLNNGFSLQYSYQTELSQEQILDLSSNSSDQNDEILQLINGDTYEYDTNTVKYYHFSSISNIQSVPEIQNDIIEIKLYPGDIFYLPAGWFHQVTSTGGRHMAINHWWKPPGWKNTVEIEKKMKYQLLKDLKKRLQDNKKNNVQYMDNKDMKNNNMDNSNNDNNEKESKQFSIGLSDEF